MGGAGDTCDTDVCIIGAGVAGAAVALALRRYTGLNVLLVERDDFSAPRSGEHLSSEALPLLQYLGLESRDLEVAHLGLDDVASAWGQRELARGFGARRGGWRLDRARFDRWLASEARRVGAAMRDNFAVREVVFRSSDEGWEIGGESCGTYQLLRSRYLVDASGPGARIARQCGAKWVTDDGLYAVVGRYAFDSRAQRDIIIEAAREGWWYAIAIPGDILIVTFVTDVRSMRTLHPTDPAGWTACLEETRHVAALTRAHRLETLDTSFIPSRLSVPVAGPGWIAVGDAALTCDPIASIGIGFALSSGANAARALAAAIDGRESLQRSYGESVERIFRTYRAHRRRVYALEGRWPDSPFWAARSTSVG